MATVTFEGVTKTFKSKGGVVRAVDSLSLVVADRELLVLAGPSGCGKTTTLRLLAGLEDMDTGTIRIGGRLVNDVAPRDRDIAMVFQNYALYPHMTVFQNMAFGLKMRRTAKHEIKQKVHDAAVILGIEHLLDRKPAALSGGERQRVAVGRAIVRKPQVFLFDEPLSNLDAKLRVHMRTEIKSLHQELATTVIYVTHDQEEAMTLGDRLVILNRGVIQQCGSPLDVYNRPVNRFVAGFVGTPSMNFLEGRLQADGKALAFVRQGDVRLTLDAQVAPGCQAHTGREVVLGIRPEHMRLTDTETETVKGNTSSSNGEGENVMKLAVTVVEPLGDRVRVHGVTSAGQSLVAQIPATASISPGQCRRFKVDTSRVHLFAADETGRRLDLAL